MAHAIEFKDVDKWFGQLHVLGGVNLDVEAGEVIVVCGPSGSGKSTLIRCVNRLEPIQKGHIRVYGESITGPGVNLARLRAEVGMVFQSFNLFPHMTAIENIMLAPVKVKGMARPEAEKIARDLLARVRIPDRADSYPANLSGGQQQRVAIARALAMQPKIMLFDWCSWTSARSWRYRSPRRSSRRRSPIGPRISCPRSCPTSRHLQKAHMLRWRPRPHAQRTGSTPRVRPSGAASPRGLFEQPAGFLHSPSPR